MKKIANILIAFIFILFAIVQWNDPDPWLWMFIYLFVALCILLFVFTDKSQLPLVIGIVITLGLSISYIPDVLRWVNDGMPNIAGSMKAESMYIEHVREFFGSIVSLITFIYYYFALKSYKNIS